jgi:hypothetical protein
MGVESIGYLGCRECDTSGSMDYEVYRDIIWCEPYRSEDRLAIFYVDVTGYGEAEEAKGFLAMDKGDYVGSSFLS